MDRPRRRPGVLKPFVLAGVALLLTAAAPAGPPPLKAMRWLAPGVAPAVLATRPPECLRPPQDADAAYKVELGRAAFRSPLILGGQAARAGVACETCHLNGRSNRNFDFPGVSGAPGTADVTSSLFSSHRGDGVDNPKPIPDLGGPPEKLKVARDGQALETFIHGLVTEEFDGPEPPPAVLDGLAAYVRAMSPSACPATVAEPVTLAGDAADARRAVRAAGAAIERRDFESAAVMVEAARARLSVIYERYDAPSLGRERAALVAADQDLAAALRLIRMPSPEAQDDLVAWLERSGDWAAALARTERQSLYSRARLARLPAAAVTPAARASN